MYIFLFLFENDFYSIFLAINEKYKWLYEYTSKYTGAVIESPVEIDYIFDTLFIEQLYNYTLPEWTAKPKQVYPEPMKDLRDLSFQLTTWTHELKRLRAGPLIQEMLDRAQNVAKENSNSSNGEDKKPEPKMLMLSGHDSTLARY